MLGDPFHLYLSMKPRQLLLIPTKINVCDNYLNVYFTLFSLDQTPIFRIQKKHQICCLAHEVLLLLGLLSFDPYDSWFIAQGRIALDSIL